MDSTSVGTAVALPAEVVSSEAATVALVERPWEVAQHTTHLDHYLVLHLEPRSVRTSSTLTV